MISIFDSGQAYNATVRLYKAEDQSVDSNYDTYACMPCIKPAGVSLRRVAVAEKYGEYGAEKNYKYITSQDNPLR